MNGQTDDLFLVAIWSATATGVLELASLWAHEGLGTRARCTLKWMLKPVIETVVIYLELGQSAWRLHAGDVVLGGGRCFDPLSSIMQTDAPFWLKGLAVICFMDTALVLMKCLATLGTFDKSIPLALGARADQKWWSHHRRPGCGHGRPRWRGGRRSWAV